MADENKLETNKELVRNFIQDCWNKGKADSIEEYVAKDCRYHDPVFPNMNPGADSLRRHIAMCRSGFSDLHFDVEDMIAERDEVVAHWIVKGTHNGTFLGMPATNRSAKVSGTSIYRLKNKKIVEQYAEWNLLSLLEQLGLATAPKMQMATGR